MALQKLNSLKESEKLTQQEMEKVTGGYTYTECFDENRAWDSKNMVYKYYRTQYRYNDQGNLMFASTVESPGSSNIC